ncbi:MAG: hypothetical protein H7831_18675, partial [Magnetococcus sp. WYHC-3]
MGAVVFWTLFAVFVILSAMKTSYELARFAVVLAALSWMALGTGCQTTRRYYGAKSQEFCTPSPVSVSECLAGVPCEANPLSAIAPTDY